MANDNHDSHVANLPAGWVWTTLGQVADIQSGAGFPKTFQGKTEGDLPFAKVSDISIAVRDNDGVLVRASNYVSLNEAQKLHAKILPAGTTVFAKIGEAVRLNRRAFVKTPLVVDNNVMGLIPNGEPISDRFVE